MLKRLKLRGNSRLLNVKFKSPCGRLRKKLSIHVEAGVVIKACFHIKIYKIMGQHGCVLHFPDKLSNLPLLELANCSSSYLQLAINP